MEIIEWGNLEGQTIKVSKQEADSLFIALDNALDELSRRGDTGIGDAGSFRVEIEEE